MSGAGLAADHRRLVDAVRAAGALVMRYFRKEPRRWEKRPGAVVTEADLAVDRLLFEALAEGTGDGWLSEEAADDCRRLGAARVWVVDPIDGTRAFVDGVPRFAISVGLLHQGRPVLGVIHNPATGALYEARDGGPALLDGAPVRVSAAGALAGARIFAGDGEVRRHGWKRLLEGVAFRGGPSLALKLAEVAAGGVDGLLSRRRSFDWDIAAADVLIRAAGGVLSDHIGRPLAYNREEPRHEGLAAGPPALHAILISRLTMPC